MSIIETVRTKCRDCYKCVRACPVKAIRVERGPGLLEFHATVVEELCVHCGTCLRECPQGAKRARVDLDSARDLLKSGEDVAASLAPSFAAVFPDPMRVVTALRKLGFKVVQETALGAEMVAWAHRKLLKKGDRQFLSSACPSFVSLVEKYYPEARKSLAPIVSPAIAHGRYLKKRYPGIHVVFIGPCVAKKDEIADPEVAGAVDIALTYEELQIWLDQEGIRLVECHPGQFDGPLPDRARAFAADGGQLYTSCDDAGFVSKDHMAVSGVGSCIEMVKHLLRARGRPGLVELLACQGGCISGPFASSDQGLYEKRLRLLAYSEPDKKTTPAMNLTVLAGGRATTAEAIAIEERSAQLAQLSMDEGSGNTDYSKLLPYKELTRSFSDKKVPVKEPPVGELRAILERSGKFTPEDELNCGACGYSSCREKAVAVFNGMADPEMCIPFMRQRAESMASLVVGTTPNGIVVTSLDGTIVDMNQSAERILGKRKKECVGTRVADHMDPRYFLEAVRTRDAARGPSEVNGLAVDQQVLYVPDQKLLVGFMADVTSQHKEVELRRQVAEEAVQRAQQIIEKQMSVAQKIAGLLGETTAETKLSLTALMKVVREEKPSSDGPKGRSSRNPTQ